MSALRQRLNEALFEVNHGEYFRARVHGWIAYVQDVDVELPAGVAERISTRFEFARDQDSADLATVDAFVIAYHAAETFWRYVFAVLDGSGPVRAPLLSMAGLKAGKTFNDRITTYVELSDGEVDELLAFAFLPPEVAANWEGEPTLEAVREYLVLWWRALARYATEWRNAYNAAKHGLAVGVRPVQFAFLSADGSGPPVNLMNGPVMRTLEHEFLFDADGRKVKDPATGQHALRWFWMYRAIDPDELIAQTIVTPLLVGYEPSPGPASWAAPAPRCMYATNRSRRPSSGAPRWESRSGSISPPCPCLQMKPQRSSAGCRARSKTPTCTTT